ncbi:unnamed protein product [Paramecium pentaurelia]|uniref:Uncharacterized protein n=1 Tax=Paramecium pentaurelia TaxID=43138 RepID=A0A8S1T1D0_9CILI|nr:unnamed protein product [Paramecium pentaurelia]
MLTQKESLGKEEDFNLNKFRDSLYLRMSSPSTLKVSSTRKEDNSVKKSSKSSLNTDLQHRKSAPSFDELLKSMNNGSGFTQLQNGSNQKKSINDSSRKMSGLQHKIECFGNNEINQLTKLSQPFISNQPLYQSTKAQQKRTTFSSSITEKPVFNKGSGKTLLDKLSLKELIELRSKVDHSTQSEVHQLSANYVQELVKLSQIITKQVKNVKY